MVVGFGPRGRPGRMFDTVQHCVKSMVILKHPFCQNIHVLKCFSAKCPFAKRFLSQNIQVVKCHCAEKSHAKKCYAQISIETRCPHAEMFLWWNVYCQNKPSPSCQRDYLRFGCFLTIVNILLRTIEIFFFIISERHFDFHIL